MKLGRWFLFLVLTSTGLSRFSPAFQSADPSELLKTVDDLVRTVARIRDLEPKSPIRRGVKSREEISRFLNQRLEQEYSESELQEEGELLQKLGLIPATLDYREFTLKMLREQIEGFYDSDTKTLYIASWLPVAEQKPVIVHELTHALQDQYFNIDRIIKEDRELGNDDRTLAHQAFLEGDGMAVMLNYQLQPVKRSFAQLADLASIMRALMLSAQSQYAVFGSAPPYLQENLLFPYGYGTAFLQKVWARDPSWQAIDKIYSDLPASTEQIMHPDKYFAHDNPKPVKEENLAARLGSNWKVTYKNVLGEFSLGLLLNLQLSNERARKSVVGWGGDQVMLLENNGGKSAAYVNTVWDGMEEAEVFFLAMRDWFQKKYPKARKLADTPTELTLIRDGEYDSLRREGTSIRFIIGLPEADGRKLENSGQTGNSTKVSPLN